MSFDAHKNFSYSTVLTAPSPPATGTSLVVQASHGLRFPTPPFNATVWPAGAQPTADNAEIVRVTAIATDTLTITRQAEGSSARAIGVGDQIAATITNQTLTDIEASAAPTIATRVGSGAGNYTTASAVYVDVDGTNLAYTVTVPVGQKLIVRVDLSQIVTAGNDGAIALADGTTILIETANAGIIGSPNRSLSHLFVGDGAQHTFKLRWKATVGTATIINSSATQKPVMTFWVGTAN